MGSVLGKPTTARGEGARDRDLQGGRGRQGRMAAAPRALGAGLRVGQRRPGALRCGSTGGAHLRRRRAGSTVLQGVPGAAD
jgi:hypothetical protein